MQTKTLESIEVLKTKEIQCRYQVRDTEAFTQTLHYEVFAPGADMTEQPIDVQNIAKIMWTPLVVTAFKALEAL